MSDKKKKADAKDEIQEKMSQPLEQLMLEKETGKYGIVPLAAIWAKELKKREELRHLPMADLIDKSLKDVLTGEVTWENIDKLKKSSPLEIVAAAGKK